jgi:hypothetical protein
MEPKPITGRLMGPPQVRYVDGHYEAEYDVWTPDGAEHRCERVPDEWAKRWLAGRSYDLRPFSKENPYIPKENTRPS